jgi:hypothetical protein
MRKIFYSWQNDTDSKYNRNFLEDCLKKAIKLLNRDIEEGGNFEFDSDTRNEPGTPEISSTILSKIKNSEVFVADITLIGKIVGKKKAPNPNVLIELGYAIATLGLKRIICMSNTKYGNPEELPFDLKNKRIFNYAYDDKSIKKDINNQVVRGLKKALELIKEVPKNDQRDNNTEELKKERDAVKITRFLNSLVVKKIHKIIEEGRDALKLDSDIFMVYYSLKGVFDYATFKLYDDNAYQVINTFMSNFDSVLSHGESFFSTLDCKSYKMRPKSRDEETQFIGELFELESSLNKMLEDIHKRYISIDLGVALLHFQKLSRYFVFVSFRKS